jgi:hypothetical protein
MSTKNQFVLALEDQENLTTTTNGALALKSTKNLALDLFASLSSTRYSEIHNNNNENHKKFFSVIEESPELAIRLLQWVRDIRGGCGERLIFRNLLKKVAETKPELITDKLIDNIIEIGRSDDILVLLDTHPDKIKNAVIKQIVDRNGLFSKWMPRQGEIAAKLRNLVGVSPKCWRKTLVETTKVVETQMCNKEWNEINFSHVPSVAMKNYTNAFKRNASEHYENYIQSLEKGEAKVNVGALYPYDILTLLNQNERLANEMWKTLPMYTGKTIFPVIDVSGSMSTTATSKLSCMDVAISLGLYLSEKQESVFKGYFATFHSVPSIMCTSGYTKLRDKVNYIRRSSWGGNTDLHKTFKLILDMAVKNDVPKEDMPEYVIVLSDMQFDGYGNILIGKHTKKMFNDAGYNCPKIIFWNLASNNYNNQPAGKDERDIIMVSGFSPAVANSILEDCESITPYNVMMKTLMQDKYSF